MGLEIIEVDDLTLAFPSRIVGTLLPLWDDISDKYKDERHPLQEIASRWFFEGAHEYVFTPREGVDANKALRMIAACMGSYEPKHQHKMAGIAYMLDEFFENVGVPETT